MAAQIAKLENHDLDEFQSFLDQGMQVPTMPSGFRATSIGKRSGRFQARRRLGTSMPHARVSTMAAARSKPLSAGKL
ncbi:MAG: hypothetical protein R3F08_03940 [Dokdonella sp.]|nr:hypothetical protein [Xanthomonadales bacterium]MCB1574142.1 hypothetical protein [Xanthomonadales bacterium]